MKLLAYVDLHDHKKSLEFLKKKVKKEKPDFLICAGDFTIFENNLKKVMISMNALGKTFLVHGNHEEEVVIRRLSKKFKNIEFVHKRIIEYKGWTIIGWGGGGFTVKESEFEAFVKDNESKLNGKQIILVTHAPFYGCKLDLLMKEHRGNKSFSNFIKKYKVKYAFCGHFHECVGEDKIRKCEVYNPGPKGKVITLQ